MASVNKVILIGNLGADPVTRYAPDGGAVTNISVATTHVWKNRDGEKQEETEWSRVVFFGRIAEVAGEYLVKGAQCYIEGRLQTKKWVDKEKVERYTTQVVADRLQLLGKKEGAREERGKADKKQGKPAAKSTSNFDQDDIPF